MYVIAPVHHTRFISISPVKTDVGASPSLEMVSMMTIESIVMRNKSSTVAWKDTMPFVGPTMYPSSLTLVSMCKSRTEERGEIGRLLFTVLRHRRHTLLTIPAVRHYNGGTVRLSSQLISNVTSTASLAHESTDQALIRKIWNRGNATDCDEVIEDCLPESVVGMGCAKSLCT